MPHAAPFFCAIPSFGLAMLSSGYGASEPPEVPACWSDPAKSWQCTVRIQRWALVSTH
ncbi:hypothetical protein L226DRAFT_538312 [Lentinus tigrinus ALCF2SS1-7]|uniref:Uncharacterized protein n=1 Tax=Lentinus tigrinus ALCF2SS1-6 TaxID=1328759 RepID=A0A5C2S0L6_9APHY|nr:hypothetical protein L227DRAFT_578505 [Lentinus tigrinus ALCF2SS1-6]RPD71182.1 hypothetical protein L226DRAFT_538312 [Lentinus tigrinus ALCF2SS1-7]